MVKHWQPNIYVIKSDPGNESEALDAPIIADIKLDTSAMSATGLLATTHRDFSGDICEVSGIDTTFHQRNPIVMLDHGLSFPLPIGKTVDPNGNYKVWIEGQDCYQTTYFSQSLKMAEQVYHLVCEGILKANSIHYRAIDWSFIPVDREKKLPQGKHVTKCMLIEATWCAIPCNPDAVMACYYKEKVNGFALAPEIKEMLSPYINTVKKSWSMSIPPVKGHMKNYKDMPDEEEKAMSSVDETQGGALRNDEKELSPEQREGSNEETPADKPDEQDVPLGKRILASMSADCKDMMECYGKMLGGCEHDKVKKLVSKHLDSIKEMCGKMDELHKSEYEGGEDEGEDKKDDSGDDGADEGDTEADYQDEPIENKSDSKSDAKSTDDRGLPDSADKPGKRVNSPEDASYAKAFQKALKVFESELKGKQEVKVETLTRNEQRELEMLERQIKRRIDFLNSL